MAQGVGFVGSTWLSQALVVVMTSAIGCGGQQNLATGTSTDPAITDADAFLNGHNQIRSQVTAPANYPGTWVPLPAMIWSDGVAATAKAWAEYLRDSEGCVARRDTNTNLGQNMAYGFVGYSAKQAVEAWASEKTATKDSPGYAFDPIYKFNVDTGHYTQMVWRNSTQLGCSSTKCTGSAQGYVLHVCFYSPPGNVDGEQPY